MSANPLTRREATQLRRWITWQVNGVNEPVDCACSLVIACQYHDDRQRTYATRLPPKTVQRLLDLVVTNMEPAP